MNNFYDITSAICVVIRDMDYKLVIKNIFNSVMTDNMNINNFASNEEIRIYGGGCVNCPSRMPSNYTYTQISEEEQRNTWLIILAALFWFPCIVCLFYSSRICYFVCKERLCNCCVKNENNNNYVIATNV